VTTLLIPVYVLGFFLLLFGALVVLGRFRGGRYLRPIMQALTRAPLLGKGLKKMSQAALERQNPELASAVRKLERLGAQKDARRAQEALAQLSKAEREAFLEAAGEELQQQGPQAVNRAQRRQMQRQRQTQRQRPRKRR
jgi:hypothetical protein